MFDYIPRLVIARSIRSVVSEEAIPTKSSVQAEIAALVNSDVELLLGEVLNVVEANKANKRLGGSVPIDHYVGEVIAEVEARLNKQGWTTEIKDQQREKYLVIS